MSKNNNIIIHRYNVKLEVVGSLKDMHSFQWITVNWHNFKKCFFAFELGDVGFFGIGSIIAAQKAAKKLKSAVKTRKEFPQYYDEQQPVKKYDGTIHMKDWDVVKY